MSTQKPQEHNSPALAVRGDTVRPSGGLPSKMDKMQEDPCSAAQTHLFKLRALDRVKICREFLPARRVAPLKDPVKSQKEAQIESSWFRGTLKL